MLYVLFFILKNAHKIVSQYKFISIKSLSCLNKKCCECTIIIVDKFLLTTWCFNFWNQYPLNFTHGYASNNLILNTKIKIGIRFYFSFTTHNIVQCKIKLFYKNIINFSLFLFQFTVEPWYLIFFKKLIFVWLVLINSTSYLKIRLYYIKIRLLGDSILK